MTQQIFAYIIHKDKLADDTVFEMITAAARLNPEALVTAIAAGSGAELDTVCKQAADVYPVVWKIDNENLAHVNAEVLRELLVRILPDNSILLVPHDHFGMDLAPGLSIKLDCAYLPDAVDFIKVEDGKLTAVREEYGGQVSTHVVCETAQGAVITVRPGAFRPDESKTDPGQVIDKTAEALGGGLPGGSRRFLEVVAAEVGDIDITKSDILVSVGRGIEDEDNLDIIFDLAQAMGGDVSCSRPIVDAKWMEKSRQVGTSGQTVKPKIYLALGISGSFQHIGGIKGSPFIVAVNKNSKAPIFQVADVGIVADILDFVPDLTDRINEMKG